MGLQEQMPGDPGPFLDFISFSLFPLPSEQLLRQTWIKKEHNSSKEGFYMTIDSDEKFSLQVQIPWMAMWLDKQI